MDWDGAFEHLSPTQAGVFRPPAVMEQQAAPADIVQVRRGDRPRQSYYRHGGRHHGWNGRHQGWNGRHQGWRHHGWRYGGYYAPRYAPTYYNNGYDAACSRKYRSYDPRSNTYMGYDGYRHRCVLR